MCSTRCAPKPTPPESRKRNLPKPTTQRKNELLNAIADALDARANEIAEANAIDMQKSAEHGMDAGKLDRLKLTYPASTQPHKVCAT